jgi:hypothetical protein
VRTTSIALCVTMVALAAASPGAAQEGRATEAREATARARAALELPRTVDSVRKHGGIPESEMGAVIGDARRRGVPAHETRDVLVAADAAIRQNGPVDNFGAFVQGRLAAGLRGRDLANAIRAEHARRGIGKGKLLSERRATGNANGRANATGAQGGGTNAKGNANAKSSPNTKGSASAKGATTKTANARDARDAAARAKQAAKAPPSKAPASKAPATKTKGRP